MAKTNLVPVVRVASLGELRVHPVTKSQLDELSRGSSASVLLNFSLFFLGIAIPLFFALVSTRFPSDRTFTVFVVFFAVSCVAGLITLVLWYRSHRSSAKLLETIKIRMPPHPIQQLTPSTPSQLTSE